MTVELQNHRYYREYVCELCGEMYSADLSRKQGEPTQITQGQCSICCASLATLLTHMNMVECKTNGAGTAVLPLEMHRRRPREYSAIENNDLYFLQYYAYNSLK